MKFVHYIYLGNNKLNKKKHRKSLGFCKGWLGKQAAKPQQLRLSIRDDNG
jgi:hypothetical protein